MYSLYAQSAKMALKWPCILQNRKYGNSLQIFITFQSTYNTNINITNINVYMKQNLDSAPVWYTN